MLYAVMSSAKTPVLSAIQLLLKSDDLADSKVRATALTTKVSMATTSLLSMPTLHPLALDVISTAFQFHFSQFEHVEQVMLRDSGPLGSALPHACIVLDSLLSHCPEGWSNTILKWAVNLLGRLSVTRGSSPTSTLEDAMKFWLTHPMLASVSGFVDMCTDNLVSLGKSQQCMESLFPSCFPHSPWLLAHVLSRHPSSLIPSLLHLILTSHLSTNDPSFLSLCQILEFLSHSHRDTLRQCVVRVVEELMCGGVGEGTSWGGRLLTLLNLATHSLPLLDAVSHDSLRVVTPTRVCSLVVEGDLAPPTEGSHDPHVTKQEEEEEEEDEGEIHSDEEEMEEGGGKGEGEEEGELVAVNLDEFVPRLVELVTLLRGSDACTALSHIMEVHREMKRCQRKQEEAMEEGEILRSPAKMVVEGCERVMSEVLSRLHSAVSQHFTPSVPSSGGLEFAVGLQGGLEGWCELLMTTELDSVDHHWLQELIVCVCVCSSELQVSEALARLLCTGGGKEQLPTLMLMYWEVQIRYPNVALTTVNSALSAIQHTKEEGERLKLLETFSTNMLLVLTRLQLTDAHSMHIRTHLTRALSKHSLKLLELLPSCHTLLDILLSLPLAEGVSSSAQCKAVSILLSHFFSLLKRGSIFLMENGYVDVSLEESLGKCKKLVVQYAKQSSTLRMFVLSVVMETIVSKEMSCYFAFPSVAIASHLTASRTQPLLSINRQLALTRVPRINTRQVQNTGTLLPRQPKQQASAKLADWAHLCVVHNTDHITQLLATIGSENMSNVASVLLDFAAPHAQPNLTHWPDGETLKCSLEWDLSVKRRFDNHPILWQVLDLISEDPEGMWTVAAIIRSLLTVLIQFWQRCRAGKTTAFPRELEGSTTLIECLGQAKWLPQPLLHISELFPELSPNEVHLLLNAVYVFMKENFSAIKNRESSFKDTGYGETIKGILITNIHKFGNLYARYQDIF